MDAATITPAANPVKPFSISGGITGVSPPVVLFPFKKYTQAEPRLVPTNGIKIPKAIYLPSILILSFTNFTANRKIVIDSPFVQN